MGWKGTCFINVEKHTNCVYCPPVLSFYNSAWSNDICFTKFCIAKYLQWKFFSFPRICFHVTFVYSSVCQTFCTSDTIVKIQISIILFFNSCVFFRSIWTRERHSREVSFSGKSECLESKILIYLEYSEKL